MFTKTDQGTLLNLGTQIQTCDTNSDRGHKSRHGIQIQTWDTNPDMGYKSGHGTQIRTFASLQMRPKNWCISKTFLFMNGIL